MDIDLLRQVFALGMRTAGARLHAKHGNCLTLIGQTEIDEEEKVLNNFISKIVAEKVVDAFLCGKLSFNEFRIRYPESQSSPPELLSRGLALIP